LPHDYTNNPQNHDDNDNQDDSPLITLPAELSPHFPSRVLEYHRLLFQIFRLCVQHLNFDPTFDDFIDVLQHDVIDLLDIPPGNCYVVNVVAVVLID
jgi:hypothetical protein